MRACALERKALPITWMGPSLAAGIGGPSSTARATTGAKGAPAPPAHIATSFLPAQCARLSTRLSCVYAHCAQATCATTDHTTASTAVPAYVCSRVWAVVLGRLRARAFCAMSVCRTAVGGSGGIVGGLGRAGSRGVRSFCLPRSRWTWAGPLGRLGRLGTRLGRSELHSRACLCVVEF